MKPLRQEDYQAMAEENQRLKREVEKIQRPRRRINWVKMVKVTGGILVSMALVSLVAFPLAIGLFRLFSKPPGYRSTPCYFVAHTEIASEPWNPWFVWRSECSGCTNARVVASVDGERRYYQEFKTRDDAWRFIQDWKLEACK